MICVNKSHCMKVPSPIEIIDEGIAKYFNDELSENNWRGMCLISPITSSSSIPLNISLPIEVTEEGIVICANNIDINQKTDSETRFFLAVEKENIINKYS